MRLALAWLDLGEGSGDMRAITYSLNRITERFPDLSEDEVAFFEECLEDCFEIGRTWDTIPILVKEAEPPAPVQNEKPRRKPRRSRRKKRAR